jgi:ligand-binding sensor domain-containing protein
MDQGPERRSGPELYEDDGGVLWVGTFAGLDRWNTRIEASGLSGGSKGSGLSTGSVGPLQADRQGVLWIGTFGGLNRFDPRTGTFSYLNIKLRSRSLSDDR